ncbi:MAG: penicillin-binding protein 2 [Spirochaetia bacterium]
MPRGFGKKQETTISKRRTIVLGILIIFTTVIYLGFLYNLQITKGMEFLQRARQVSRRTIPIPAQRGEIFDRNFDTPLVTNIDSYAVDIIPAEVPQGQFEELFQSLAEILEMEVQAIRDAVPPSNYHLYQSVEIKSGVDFETIVYIAEHIQDFPGVGWHSKPIRSYVETGSIAHVLGYVGDITREELQVLYNAGYTSGSVIGKSGIERRYDQILRGEDGTRYRTVDVTGRRVIEDEILEEVPPVLGNDLVLTIDRHTQRLAEQALGERIGSVIVLKPSTGEVLAMVSYPYYNPNQFYTENGNHVFRELSLNPYSPFLNRTIQSLYPPASTFKIIMSLAMLEEEVLTADQEITCDGSITLGDRRFNCWRQSGHGPVALLEAFAHSCNIYYYTVGREYLGIERIADYANRFGFGLPTGIDLPGELSGLVPTPQWKERSYNSPWVGGDTVNTSIGQGYLLVTPLQIANAVAMIANDGVVYRPHLVSEIRDPISNEVIHETEPEVLLSPPFREEMLQQVQDAMRMVVTEGTAQFVITTDAVESAGKTGTGQVAIEENFHSWYVSYAPYEAENPEDQVVIVTQIEAVNEYEWWAPKATNIILQGIFAGQTYEEAVESMSLWY